MDIKRENTQSPKEICNSLVDILQWRGINESARMAYQFFHDENNWQTLTYQELDQKAKEIGGFLQSIGQPGARVILFFNPGVDYITAFYGCMYAGMIAVPSYPPKFNREVQRVDTILSDAGATIVLTTDFILSNLGPLLEKKPALKELHWVNFQNIPSGSIHQWKQPALSREDICYLQYTSGSTADPKGVMVSHGNLIHNLDMIGQNFGNTQQTIGVSWLPPYHDMGLIGGILQPVYVGFAAYHMSPFLFLQNPAIWLKTISRYRASCSGGPNFAYELCLERISPSEQAALDLSCWELAFNGSEPVRYETIERFSQRFGPVGFRKEAFYPCYGLAEATLFVTGREKMSPPRNLFLNEDQLNIHQVVLDNSPSGKPLVGSGQAFPGETIVIVEPENSEVCPESQVGEIWVASDSVAKGYWQKQPETERTFQAYIASSGAGPYLRTGDLGFLHEGELYVTGRLKDLIIIRGKNHYPHDIELTVETSHEALQPGSGAAFSVEINGEERLVIVQEVKRSFRNADPQEVGQAVRTAVSEAHELQVYDLVLIPMLNLPKTTSGKIQRQLTKKKYLNGELNIIGQSRAEGLTSNTTPDNQGNPATEEKSAVDELLLSALKVVSQVEDRQKVIAVYLKKKIAAIIRVREAQLDEAKPLTGFGLDSLMAVDLVHHLETVFGVAISMSRVLEGMSISELALEIAQRFQPNETGDNQQLSGQTSEDNQPSSPWLPKFLAGEPLPLSRGQQALWFLHQIAKESAAYHLAYAVRIRRPLNSLLLKRTLETIAERHPLLQAVFRSQNTGLVQTRNTGLIFELREKALPDATAAEIIAELNQAAAAPFNLETGPLVKVLLVQKSETDYFLLMVIHHIIADFWSLSIFIDELSRIYQALTLQQPLLLALPRRNYFDYIYDQEEWVKNNSELAGFWKEYFHGELPVLNLPTDFVRPVAQTYRGASCFAKLNPEGFHKFKALGLSNGSTLFMNCLAAFYLLLSRYTGQDDIIVGSPTSGRNSAATADIIGYFVNPVAIRLEFSGNPSFIQLLSQVKQTVLNAFAHQEYPFETLVETLQVRRDISRSPIFQVMFSYQKSHDPNNPALALFAFNETGTTMNLNGLKLEFIPLANQTAQFDLTLTTVEKDDGLGLSLQYNQDLFKEETIARMLQHFLILLHGITEQPERPVRELPILTKHEWERIVYQWNATEAAYEKVCLHHLFERQVEQRGPASAVIFENTLLTYQELNRRANQLAHYLKRVNPENGKITALFFDRSLDLAVGLLGVLKAGGCYLPIDPAYPKDRIAYILNDAAQQGAPPLVITQGKMAQFLPAYDGKVVRIDEDWPEIAQEPDHNPEIQVNPEDLAYLIYTSGTTGNPKGVMIPHRAIVNFLHSMRKQPGLTPADIMLSVTTISFDIAALEIFLPLISGAVTVFVPFENTLSGSLLAQEIERNQVTIMQATPSVYRLLLDSGWPGNPGLKVLCGGEAFPPDLAARLLPIVKEVWNMYGPTETTVWSTIYRVETTATNIPIGRPIDNTQVYILDSAFNPVPIGVSGELYIGGDGVALGYFHNPALTKERFLPNPFINKMHNAFAHECAPCIMQNEEPVNSEHSGINTETNGFIYELCIMNSALIYKTGDLACYLPDGTIKHLGRADFQIKLHGHRIEIGEIEASLSKYPGIRETVVVMREDPSGDKRLVAYYVAENQTPNVTEMRNFLKEKMPEYMIPSVYMALPAFPRTPNGKIDRKALPMPENIRPELNTEYVQPGNPEEQLIANLWSENLGLDQIGIHDNFFDLGGTSVKMAQIYQRLSQSFPDQEFSIVELFQYPTVHSLAQYLRAPRPSAEEEQIAEEQSTARRQRRKSLAGERETRRNQRE